MSVDLAGSTAFKVAAKGLAESPTATKATAEPSTVGKSFQRWLPVFTGFYYQFPERLRSAFEVERARDLSSDLGEEPVFWKPIGDELVFTKRLTDAAQALRTIGAFRSAILEYRLELKKKHAGLDLKASAWLAGFPVANTQVAIGNAEDLGNLDLDGEPVVVAYRLAKAMQAKGSSARVDYLGPALDVGFRLGKLATARCFVLSIDLAFLISKTNESTSDDSIRFRYSGRVELKGVLGNMPYPVFWIDMEPTEFEKLEDKLEGRDNILASEVHKLAATFIASTDGKICKPYLVGADGKACWGNIPPEHAAILKLIADEADEEAERERAALNDASEPVREIQPAIVQDLIPEEMATIRVEKPPTTEG